MRKLTRREALKQGARAAVGLGAAKLLAEQSIELLGAELADLRVDWRAAQVAGRARHALFTTRA